MSVKLTNIGYGNMISAGRLLAIVNPESAPIKRLTQEAREAGRLIDGTVGRRTRAVLIMDSGHVVLSALQPETLAGRIGQKEIGRQEDAGDDAGNTGDAGDNGEAGDNGDTGDNGYSEESR
ncbi:MAG: DUF370 domain-containing protein [Peptococcaceae bacterium]|jgi:regulator of extracellular matrix RemA (YlzA/DUF370 family)|nr:DUF370 domain-containing protein [Peptococcaceae bacterium]